MVCEMSHGLISYVLNQSILCKQIFTISARSPINGSRALKKIPPVCYGVSSCQMALLGITLDQSLSLLVIL